MSRVGDEIVVIRDVPALICDTCGEIEYTLEVSRQIDLIMKDFFEGRLLAKHLAAGEIVFKPQRAESIAGSAFDEQNSPEDHALHTLTWKRRCWRWR